MAQKVKKPRSNTAASVSRDQALSVESPKANIKRRQTTIEEEEYICVAVRIRPFNNREKKKGSRLVCDATKRQLILADPEVNKSKKFTFDHVYWSYDNTHGGFVTQDVIFEDLGHMYVDNAFKGFNSSVFAYGQTGSGKTYTMLGTAKNPGLIPRGCEELFRRIDVDYRPRNIEVEVEASYLEVYMDRIFDLLASPDSKKTKKTGADRQKLPIRFHPKKGAYVEGLTRHAVGGYRDVQKLMNVGLANRTVAETQMNKISSRSHCIFTLFINQYGEGGEVTASKINLIDLAGSERVNKTGVVGERMEELKKINKSLSALGDVISALSQNAKFVPYNNSVLTTLLKESLGGNSKTIMMAAVSPASDNFDETMSTLRYAARVKKIKLRAKKNKGESKEVREKELKAEITKLKKMLDMRGSGNKSQVGQLQTYLDNSRDELRRVQMEHDAKIREMHKVYEQMQDKLQSMGLSMQGVSSPDEAIQKSPKLINLSGDPSLSGQMVFFLTTEEITIGNENGRPRPLICLAAHDTSIRPQHCVIRILKTQVDVNKEALDIRRQIWKLLFDESDLNKDNCLNLSEFNVWTSQVLQHEKHFQGFTPQEFAKVCAKYNEDPGKGLSFESLLKVVNHEDEDDGDVPQNIIHICGIPKAKINQKLVGDMNDFIFEEHDVKSVKPKSSVVEVVFSNDMQDDDITAVEQELIDMFGSTGYGTTIKCKRPGSKEMKVDKPNLVFKVKITLESADPGNGRIMIFVNGERVQYNPIQLAHGDHILLGTNFLFQLVIPAEAIAQGGPKNATVQAGKDMELVRDFIEKEKAHRTVATVKDLKELIKARMANPAFRESNIDALALKEQLLAQRQAHAEQSTSGEATHGIHDAFMGDYRMLSSKTNHANTMSMELGKQVLYNVGTLAYFDSKENRKNDRIVILRECHYSDPEFVLQMSPPQFEDNLKQLTRYYELSKQDGEDIAQETMDDDPFVPGEIDTLLGESVVKITGRKVQPDAFEVPLLRNLTNDQIGKVTVQVQFQLTKEKNKVCYDFRKMENKKVQMSIDVLNVELDIYVKGVYLTFCGVGPEIITFRSDPNIAKATNVFDFDEAYQVPSMTVTPSFRNYLAGTGILLRIWVPVFDDPQDMPPIIAYKINSRQVTLNVKIPTGDTIRLKAKTGNTVEALKRKLDFATEIADDQQTIIFNKTTLENHRTLLDYGVTDESHITLMVSAVRRQKSMDAEFHDIVQIVQHEVGAGLLTVGEEEKSPSHDTIVQPQQVQDAISKELTNPNLTAQERKKLRRVKNRSVHMAMMEVEAITGEPMSLESYQAENKKLREALRLAQVKIQTLERELANSQTMKGRRSQGAPKKKASKFFGGWRRPSKNLE